MAVSALGPIQPASQAARPAAPQTTRAGKDGGFLDMVTRFAGDVDAMQHDAEAAVADLAAGKADNLHQVTLALGKAEVSFKFMMEVRNKLVDAYREVMRMPV